MGIPLEHAQTVVEGAHTSAEAAGVVFDMVRPRMAAMWHCMVVDGHIEPIFEDVAVDHGGAVTLCQDLAVFNVRGASVSACQALVDPVASTVIGASDTERTLTTPHDAPTRWKDAAIHWRKH